MSYQLLVKRFVDGPLVGLTHKSTMMLDPASHWVVGRIYGGQMSSRYILDDCQEVPCPGGYRKCDSCSQTVFALDDNWHGLCGCCQQVGRNGN